MAKTTFLQGKKHHKDTLIFEVLGDFDELNCLLGWAKLKGQKVILEKIQKDLMAASSFLAGCAVAAPEKALTGLEKQIKNLEKTIHLPKKFILPGESESLVRLHLARAVARRAERHLIALSRKQKIPKALLDYLNRLSWLLFLLAAAL